MPARKRVTRRTSKKPVSMAIVRRLLARRKKRSIINDLLRTSKIIVRPGSKKSYLYRKYKGIGIDMAGLDTKAAGKKYLTKSHKIKYLKRKRTTRKRKPGRPRKVGRPKKVVRRRRK